MTNASTYAQAYGDWMRDPEAYWATEAQGLAWSNPWDTVFDPTMGTFGQWFPGGLLNTCHNCLDRHVEAGRGEQAALIHDSPMTGTVRRFTYNDLLARTALLAGALAELGVTRGDRVVIYMPMVPEAAIAMLATARLGAVHSVVFGGFAAAALASRIADAKPKVIISASCGSCNARRRPQPWLPAGTMTSTQRSTAHRPTPAFPSWRPTRFTSCTPPAPRDARKALCATTEGTRSCCGTPCA